MSASSVQGTPTRGGLGSPKPDLTDAVYAISPTDGGAFLNLDMYASPSSPILHGSSPGKSPIGARDVTMYFPSTNRGGPPKGEEPMFSLKLNVPRLPNLGGGGSVRSS